MRKTKIIYSTRRSYGKNSGRNFELAPFQKQFESKLDSDYRIENIYSNLGVRMEHSHSFKKVVFIVRKLLIKL